MPVPTSDRASSISPLGYKEHLGGSAMTQIQRVIIKNLFVIDVNK